MLAGRRITLRPISRADAPLLLEWFSDPAIFKGWGGKPLSAEVVARKYFARRRSRLESFIVQMAGRPIGYAQASRDRGETAIIDVVLVPAARGRGLGSDAIRTLVRHLRSQIHVKAITAYPAPRNVAALRALRKAGFVRQPSGLAILGTGV